eukprot:300384-Hanusia_phi.AAC.1
MGLKWTDLAEGVTNGGFTGYLHWDNLYGDAVIPNDLKINGNVGIGTAPSATYNLDINGGNVSIGSNTTTYKLNVAGNLNCTGSLYFNGTIFQQYITSTTSDFTVSGGQLRLNTSSSYWMTGTPPVLLPTNAIYYSGAVSVGTTTTEIDYTFISSGNSRIGNIVADRGTFNHGSSILTLTHQSPTSSSVLNDPQPVLHLCRQGTSGQAYGARASFYLSRYENSGVSSRTRLDLYLANDGYNNVNVMTMRSNGNIGIANDAPIGKNNGAGGNRHVRLGYNASFDFVIGDYGAMNAASTWSNQFRINYAAPADSLVIDGSGNTSIYGYLLINGNNTISTGSVLMRYMARDEDPSTSRGTNTFNTALKVTGSTWTTGIFITTSDARIKKDFIDLDDNECLNIVNQLKPRKYKYKDPISKGTSDYVIGFIAQEVEEVLPYA